jgi:hypothetical protein
LLVQRTAADGEDDVNAGIQKAFTENALANHSGCAEEDDFHEPPRPRQEKYAGVETGHYRDAVHMRSDTHVKRQKVRINKERKLPKKRRHRVRFVL